MFQAYRVSWRSAKQAIAIYPGLGDVGAAVLASCPRSLIFGGTATVEQYKGNPRVQAHGPGFSKILLGDDKVDDWRKYLDIMVDSVLVNSGRGCINCSGIWASRHTEEIAEALAERMGPVQPLPPDDPKSALAAFTVPGQADAVSASIDADVKEAGTKDMTAKYGSRLVKAERSDYLRPTVLLWALPERAAAKNWNTCSPSAPWSSVRKRKMLDSIGPTLVVAPSPRMQNFSGR